MVELRIAGIENDRAAATDTDGELGLAVAVKADIRVRGGRAAGETVTIQAADDDLVELELEGGAVIWLQASEAAERLGVPGSRSADGAIELAPALPLDDRRRGLGEWAIEGLRLLGIDLPEKGAFELARALEDKVVPRPGLFRWDGHDQMELFAEGEAGLKPWLVFLHGTASSTQGGFGDLKLLQEGLWQRLAREYDGRILAFEHHTLTVSPIANALDLVEALPAGAELHLVSHSRGGLVGELIGRGQLTDADGKPRAAFDETEIAAFKGAAFEKERQTLGRLNEALGRKALRVTRFVRVACPARGTSLMGERIDRWLNLVFNVLGLATGGRLNPVTSTLLDGLGALVKATVKQRTEPRTLPGLAAMSPECSPLVQVLNRVEARQSDGLCIIAGDVEPTAVLQRLALWFADLYFGRDHDLVVDTASMEGGARRLEPPFIFRDQGPKVTHFNYFAAPASANVLTNALVDHKALSEMGAVLARAAEEPMPRPRSRGVPRQLPIVMLLPGISGTHLEVGGKRVWIDLLSLARGGVGKLAIERSNVAPDELVGRYYGDLFRFLEASHEVRAWPYDWRRSIQETGRLFARDLGLALDETERAVRIVAHSMGGLVARTALAQDPELRRRFNEREGSRLVMLGTPNGGSFAIPMLLLGRNRLMQYLALLDFKADAAEQLEIVSAWPGAIQMLPQGEPNGDGGLDLFAADAWDELAEADGGKGWHQPKAELLADARRFGQFLKAAPVDRERMLYVAGQADTYDAIEIRKSGKKAERIRFRVTPEGDGQVLWRTGIPKGVKAWYTTAAHGDLARHEPAFPAILDLLQRGQTDQLPKTPPAVLRPRAAPAWIVREPVHLVPSEDDLLATAMGAEPWVPPRQDRRVAVRVVNGDLKFARHPLMVGHYIGDSLNGSELVLDQEQHGRISRRRDRGLHPGKIRTFDVHLDERLQPPGSVIVGLGEVAELTGGRLRQSVRQGLMALATAMDERDERTKTDLARPPRPRGVSTVLIGSGAGIVGVLDCVQAILRAVREVNLELGEKGFVELEVIERVEQRAINAWHAFHQRLTRAEFSDAFTLGGEVARERGAWRRIGAEGDPDWWTPITIQAAAAGDAPDGDAKDGNARDGDAAGDGAGPAAGKGSGALRYVVLGGRARAEATLVATRRSFIDRYLQRISRQRVETGPMSAARTLFELLWPNDLKEHSLDDRNIRLTLDETAAALPWEMMDDRRHWLTGGVDALAARLGPPAVRFGIVRQLVSTQIRETAMPAASAGKALVIGDPIGDGSALAELPGAQAEARAVQALLERHGYAVTPLIGRDARPEDIVSALFAEAWQIIHIAGHGVFEHCFTGEPSTAKKTGIVLGGRPETLVLDSAMLQQMPVTPEVVFVNCCSLGKLDPSRENEHLRANRPALASSIAVQLIRMGVRAVVAAGWEVGDDPASRFAEVFYEGMLAGHGFGNTVKEARGEIYAAAPNDSTWGAYQVYGHPDFQLSHVAPAPRHPPQPPLLAAPAEALSEIARITAMLNVGGNRDEAADREALMRIQEAIAAKGWLGQGEIRSALAAAFAELHDLDAAIEHYKAAASDEMGQVPLRAIEQQLNLATRRAAADPTTPDAAKGINQSIKQLDQLIAACGETQERLSLLGGAYKRLAQVESGNERTNALRHMEQAYRRARQRGQKLANPEVYYPWSQEIAGKVILGLRTEKPSRPNIAGLERTLPPAAPDDFWRRVLPADLRLLQCLTDGALSGAEQAEIAGLYVAVWKDTGSSRELSSVLAQVDFLIAMLEDAGSKTETLVAALQATKARILADTRGRAA